MAAAATLSFRFWPHLGLRWRYFPRIWYTDRHWPYKWHSLYKATPLFVCGRTHKKHNAQSNNVRWLKSQIRNKQTK